MKLLNVRNLLLNGIMVVGMVGCSNGTDLRGGDSVKLEKLGGDASANANAAGSKKVYALCEPSDEHKGFGGRLIESQTAGNLVETNKDQLKPFTGLRRGYQRLGLSSACLDSAEASIWFSSCPLAYS